MPDKIGKQELEIYLDGVEYYFTTSKIGSLSDVKQCSDPEGLRVFYYLVQDLKCFLFSLIYKTGLKHLYNVPPFLCTKNVNVPY
ncbi:hypothetical protein C923_01939 [Plasmodium falciparum UGT5.1]|uniref:Uncharacterized protein n=1 Tax=Plasmodium falciparum UGT5.1 TaxID=1237627 RepID=W7JQU9_PLAFA|nr:hypothetical protein C923_01939 [Plasmodium falciparum UGT5.1]